MVNIHLVDAHRVPGILSVALAAAMLAAAAAAPAAAECQGEKIAAGTVLNAANLSALSEKCLGPVRLGAALSEHQAWQIREHKLEMRLMATTAAPPAHRTIRATEKYAGAATLGPDRTLENYHAGRPFTTIDPNDPDAGVKVVWNHIYGQPRGDQFGLRGGSVAPNFVYTLIEGQSGLERIQEWQFSRFHMRGRTEGEPTLGDGSILDKSVLFAVSPQDIKGLGTFTIRYHTPQLNDTWAYVRSVRRVRRLSGGAWVDPVGGTDQLQDDIWWNSHPAWYSEIKLVGKGWVMHPTESAKWLPEDQRAAWQPGKPTVPEQFPRLVFHKPYWNVDDVWMPRAVYIVEGIPPGFHPYGRRVVYMDVENDNYLISDIYDKRNEYWKSFTVAVRPYPADDGFIDPKTGKPELYYFTAWGQIVDFPRRHATLFHVSPEFYMFAQGTSLEDLSLARLEAAGR